MELRQRKKDYIALDVMSTPPSSGSEDSLFNRNHHVDADSSNTVLFDKRTVQKTLGSKVHKGFGMGKIPLAKVTPSTALAGDEHMQVFSSHLGAAAADPNNFITAAINKNRMDKVRAEIANQDDDELSAAQLHRYIKDGLLTRNQADIEHGLYLLEEKEAQQKANNAAKALANKQKEAENINKLEEGIKAAVINAANVTPSTTPDTGHDGWIPGYPHVGPGNKVHPTPANAIDNIARTHDINYGNSKTPTDIRKADEEFIQEMGKIEPKTWGETAIKHGSKLAIQAKKTAEEITGHVFYPSEVNNYASRK